MEDPESAEKQENTGVAPANACRRPAGITARCTAHGTRESTSCALAKRSQRGFWRNEANGMLTGVRLELARADLTRASIFFAKKLLRRGIDCGVKPRKDEIIRWSCPRLARSSTSCFFVRQNVDGTATRARPSCALLG